MNKRYRDYLMRSLGVLGAFVIGWGGAAAIAHRSAFAELFFEAHLARYEAVTSEDSGPADYYVVHNDFAALQSLQDSEPDILHIEQTALRNIASVSFASPRSAALGRVREHAVVAAVFGTALPLICH